MAGLVIYYFGDGKGKTTGALGIALRAAGAGKSVKIIQFIKGNWTSSEEIIIAKIDGIKIEKGGLGFVESPDDKLPISKHKEAAREALEKARRSINKCDILILDEIGWAIEKKLVKIEDLLKFIKKVPESKTLVLTGAPKISELVKIADLVTEMKKIKHPYDKGVSAVKGVDY